MDIEKFLPVTSWISNHKDLLKKPEICAVLASGGLLVMPLPFFFLRPFVIPLIWSILIRHFLEEQKKKRIRAILDAFPARYTESDLLEIYKSDRKEFNRLYKLASDEFFRKYVQEQADHKKAQELIKELQTRIEEMRQRLTSMEEKGKKYREDIEGLKEEITLYEDVLSGWKREVVQYGPNS